MTRPDLPDPSDDERRLRRRGVLIIAGIFLAEGLLRTGYMHFGARARYSDLPFLDSLISESTGSIATVIVFLLIIVPLSRSHPVRGPAWPRNLAVHAGALVVYSLLKTLLMWGMRETLFPLAGLGNYDYGDMSYRFTMEFSNDVFGYALLAFVVHAWDAWHATRERQLREARLEASLGAARLQALQAQLQPHFLFNTLNAISSVMYSDPERADRLISRLSDLLRTSLAAPQRPEVPLEEELRSLDEYVEIMRARFGERLNVAVDVARAAAEARVPVFLLQPLVENAIRHGVAERSGAGHIDIIARRDGADLVLRVLDDGPGLTRDAVTSGTGVGLSNTRERLQHLYGDGASLRLANRPEGGAVAEVRLPFVRAAADTRPAGTHTAEPANV